MAVTGLGAPRHSLVLALGQGYAPIAACTTPLTHHHDASAGASSAQELVRESCSSQQSFSTQAPCSAQPGGGPDACLRFYEAIARILSRLRTSWAIWSSAAPNTSHAPSSSLMLVHQAEAITSLLQYSISNCPAFAPSPVVAQAPQELHPDSQIIGTRRTRTCRLH